MLSFWNSLPHKHFLDFALAPFQFWHAQLLPLWSDFEAFAQLTKKNKWTTTWINMECHPSRHPCCSICHFARRSKKTGISHSMAKVTMAPLGNIPQLLPKFWIDLFNLILFYIAEDLQQINEAQANCHGGHLIPKLCLFCILCYLAGGAGLYLNIQILAGILQTLSPVAWMEQSLPLSTALIWLSKCPSFQKNDEQHLLASSQSALAPQSPTALMSLIVTFCAWKPHLRKIWAMCSLFSDQCQAHGVNIQAVLDCSCWFTYIGGSGPGSRSDSGAFLKTWLKEILNVIVDAYVLISDCAHDSTKKLVSLRAGIYRLKKWCIHFLCITMLHQSWDGLWFDAIKMRNHMETSVHLN